MIYLICWLVSAVVGAIIGNVKARPTAGAFWGFVLGPFGWLLMALVPDDRPKCAECLGAVSEGARKCRHCGSLIDQLDEPQRQSSFDSLILGRTWCDLVAVGIVGITVALIWREAARVNAIGEDARRTFQQVAEQLSENDPVLSSNSVESKTATTFRSIADNLSPRLTLANYERLANGMTFQDVCGIIGENGRQVTQREITNLFADSAPVDSRTYIWDGDGKKSGVMATFHDDRLVERLQFGLR